MGLPSGCAMQSNWFLPSNLTAFRVWISHIWHLEHQEKESKHGTLVQFFSGDITGVPQHKTWYGPDGKEDGVEADLFEELPDFIAPGWVCVVKECGYLDDATILVGRSWAVNSTGQVVEIDVDTIYQHAEQLGQFVMGEGGEAV